MSRSGISSAVHAVVQAAVFIPFAVMSIVRRAFAYRLKPSVIATTEEDALQRGLRLCSKCNETIQSDHVYTTRTGNFYHAMNCYHVRERSSSSDLNINDNNNNGMETPPAAVVNHAA